MAAHQAPQSLGFSRQEHWSGLPFPTPEDLPDPGIKLASLASLALAGGFFTTVPPGKPTHIHKHWPLLVAQMVKNTSAMRETWVLSLGWEDLQEEGMVTHPSRLTWRIPMDRGAWQATQSMRS